MNTLLSTPGHHWCAKKSKFAPNTWQRKFFYLLTCEYCFSHYVAAAFIALTKFQLLVAGWRGYLLAWLSLVWIANAYMSIFGRLRLDIKQERLEIAATEASDSHLSEHAAARR